MVQARQIQVRYHETPEARRTGDRLDVTLPTDAERPFPALELPLARPGLVREALLALGDVFESDLRRKASDRSDYLAYLMRSGKKATQAVWDAQRAFLEAKYGEAKQEATPLDPALTLSPEGLSLEVLSRDESAYARLVLAPAESSALAATTTVTTTVPWTRATRAAIARVRAFRGTTVALAPSTGAAAAPRAIPLRWLRAFGQTLIAASQPARAVSLAPIDLYNVLLSLRRRRAKKPPRALRFELVPGEPPRLALEPWDLLITSAAGPYAGARAAVVRTFGRDRLQLLARLLPHAARIDVRLGDSGMPTFYALDLGGGSSFTLALSGWTDSGWAGISLLDAQTSGEDTELLARQLLGELAAGPRALAELVAAGRDRREAAARAALDNLLLTGRAGYDVTTGRYSARALLADPPAPAELRYRDATEEKARRLLDATRVEKLHALGAEGTRLEGVVEDAQAHRTLRPSLTVDREGRTSDAACGCARFLRAGLREGPCEHMIALRLAHARDEAAAAAARETPEGRKLIRAETRSFLRRRRGAAEYAQLVLDDRTVIARDGREPAQLRVARLHFNSADAARAEYFTRLEALERAGFMDTQLDPQEVRL